MAGVVVGRGRGDSSRSLGMKAIGPGFDVVGRMMGSRLRLHGGRLCAGTRAEGGRRWVPACARTRGVG